MSGLRDVMKGGLRPKGKDGGGKDGGKESWRSDLKGKGMNQVVRSPLSDPGHAR